MRKHLSMQGTLAKECMLRLLKEVTQLFGKP
jgi:hypothetical protein